MRYSSIGGSGNLVLFFGRTPTGTLLPSGIEGSAGGELDRHLSNFVACAQYKVVESSRVELVKCNDDDEKESLPPSLSLELSSSLLVYLSRDNAD